MAGGMTRNGREGRRGTEGRRGKRGETAGGEGKSELCEGGAEMNKRTRGRKEP